MRILTLLALFAVIPVRASEGPDIDGRWLFSREASIRTNEEALAHPMWAGRDPWEVEFNRGITIGDGLIEFLGDGVIDEPRPFSLRPAAKGTVELIAQGDEPFVVRLRLVPGGLCLLWEELFIDDIGWFDPEAHLEECFVRDDAQQAP